MLKEIADQLASDYAPLKPETIRSMNGKGNMIHYKKGERLARVGQYHHHLFYLVKGSLKAYYLKDNKRIIDWFTFQHEFITSSTSYFTNEPGLHYIEAMEDCLVYEIPKENVEWMCEEHHDFEHLFRLVLSKVIVQFRRRIVSIQFKTVKERYQSLIEQYPKIELTAPLGDIASFLGITQETLSRIRASKE